MSDPAEDFLDAGTQREDQRIAVYAVARLGLEEGTEHACEVLNVSAGGAMVKLESGGSADGEIVLDLAGVGRFPGHVAWRHKQFLGLAFIEKVADIDAIVRAISAAGQANEEKRRHKRTSVLWRGRLYAGGKTHEVRVLNISPAGAKLRAPALTESTAVMLIVDRAGEVPARVVWSDNDQLGLRFLDQPHEICELFGDLLPAMRVWQRGDPDDEPR